MTEAVREAVGRFAEPASMMLWLDIKVGNPHFRKTGLILFGVGISLTLLTGYDKKQGTPEITGAAVYP